MSTEKAPIFLSMTRMTPPILSNSWLLQAGFAEGFLSASLMSSADTPTAHINDPEESNSVHEHPPELDLTDEEDELHDQINSQINPDLTNVEWQVVQMLIAEAHKLQDHIDLIHGLLQPVARTRFP